MYVEQDVVAFRVRACSDAHIAVSPRNAEDDWWVT